MLLKLRVVIVMLVAIAALGMAACGPSPRTKLSVVTSTSSVKAGSTFTVEIRLSTQDAWDAVAFAFSFPADKVRCIDVTRGPDLGTFPSYYGSNPCADSDGVWNNFSGGRRVQRSTGDFELATVTFSAGPGTGSAPLSFTAASVSGSNGTGELLDEKTGKTITVTAN